MNQCSKIFIDSLFEESLDSKRDLIGFNNGVYDLEKGILDAELKKIYKRVLTDFTKVI